MPKKPSIETEEDLIRRLREIDPYEEGFYLRDLCAEAAEVIERLISDNAVSHSSD